MDTLTAPAHVVTDPAILDVGTPVVLLPSRLASIDEELYRD